ncbi:hypothetical protein GDO78_017655 [Eleutherodactylus coqui]|uniref:Uncharacterized protein n=1 Tax=Eleutherodactylus coqui TaxID=57060 RepID=A0A8J6BLH9_ELECQ|nr:hypothetical protein GDO78_017655 [Eleutherodactylus coqui]
MRPYSNKRQVTSFRIYYLVLLQDAVVAKSEILPNNSVSEPSLSRHRRHKMREEMSSHPEQFPLVYPRPLPSPPALRAAPTSHSSPERKATTADSNNGSKPSSLSQDHRPLSARERRRLKQSQEELTTAAPPVRRSSVQAVDGGQAVNSAYLSLPSVHEKRRHSVHECYTEDDLSSSTNSLDKSEGDYKVRKNSDSGEMNDLVNLMTQTLHMEKEFRVHKRYRDTFMLHGRTADEQEDICLALDNLTVPEKFRRMIEALRAEVVQGLGVKVLEEVYNAMDEEDDNLRELHLQRLLGEKYNNYNLKVRQLKFFEENSKF